MDRPSKARPESNPRDPFRRPRGSYEPFGTPNGGRGEASGATPPPPPPASSPPPPPPPRGQGPGWDDYDLGSPPPPHGRAPDLSILVVFVEALRRLLPGELQGQFNSLLREVLKTLRSLIDWYLERLDRGPRKPEVEDIPID